MDDFTNMGVCLQLLAMIVLLLNILCTRNCTGISGKTQVLHVLVFTTRFLDLPYEFQNSASFFTLKIVYIVVAYLTVISIYVICKQTYEREHDTFRIELLIGACTVMALLASCRKWELLNVCKYFSIFLETFAIFPQIQFTANSKYAGSSLVFYIGLLAFYRGFHVVHWTYGYWFKEGISDFWIVIAGTIQFVIYCGYFIFLVPIFKDDRHQNQQNPSGTPWIHRFIRFKKIIILQQSPSGPDKQ